MQTSVVQLGNTALWVDYTIDVTKEQPIEFESIRLMGADYAPEGQNILHLLDELFFQVSEGSAVPALNVIYNQLKEVAGGSEGIVPASVGV
jgi:hypothetical protein